MFWVRPRPRIDATPEYETTKILSDCRVYRATADTSSESFRQFNRADEGPVQQGVASTEDFTSFCVEIKSV